VRRHDRDCPVPGPHRHRPPNKVEVAEARYSITVEHPPTCMWRKDIYTYCDCGVTTLTMQLEDAMHPRVKP
jgi:hypothetical protein